MVYIWIAFDLKTIVLAYLFNYHLLDLEIKTCHEDTSCFVSWVNVGFQNAEKRLAEWMRLPWDNTEDRAERGGPRRQRRAENRHQLAAKCGTKNA